MLSSERMRRICEIVELKGSVSTQTLMDELGISESTVRRDLTVLDREGRILKVRGGALARERLFHVKDDTVSERKDRNQEEKRRIARFAAGLIRENDFVYLDAGTTTERMIPYLEQENVTFVTNAVSHARALSEAGYTTYILGGEFKAATEAVVGEEAIQSLKKYNFTKGFFGTNGISRDVGFSTPDVKEAAVKRQAMRNSLKAYVLADTSKFSQISCVKFGEFANADIITTKILDDEYRDCPNVMEVDDR